MPSFPRNPCPSASVVIPAQALSFPRKRCHSRASVVIPAQAGIQQSKDNTSYNPCHSRASVVIPAQALSFPRKRESPTSLSFPRKRCHSRASVVIPAQAGISPITKIICYYVLVCYPDKQTNSLSMKTQ